MQKENSFFFAFPSASNFGEGRVTKRAVTKDGFWKIKVCQGECAGGQSPLTYAAKSQVGVDYRGQNMVKFVQNEKYSTKSGDFLRFFAYLCHVIDDFACFDLQH